ncbi:uncharacterized protein LOC144156086 [Haemaphysalis longicornis]
MCTTAHTVFQQRGWSLGSVPDLTAQHGERPPGPSGLPRYGQGSVDFGPRSQSEPRWRPSGVAPTVTTLLVLHHDLRLPVDQAVRVGWWYCGRSPRANPWDHPSTGLWSATCMHWSCGQGTAGLCCLLDSLDQSTLFVLASPRQAERAGQSHQKCGSL